jgi:hypothetical protein
MLKIKRLIFSSAHPSPEEISASLDENCNYNRIEIDNWPEFPYTPEVSFLIGHADTEIYLKFFVKEYYIRAKYTDDNTRVWTDSCVEFYISFINDQLYYNLEFNCIGSTLLAYGRDRFNREYAPPEILDKIKRFPSLGKNPIESKSGLFVWNLFLIIPSDALFKHKVKRLTGEVLKANFYKCGDELKRLII